MSRILVIDDDPGNRLIVKSRLSDLGYEVLLAESGAGGLVEARGSGADLFLVAGHLGSGIDSVEVCRRLKAIPETNAVRVCLYSHASSTQEEIARAYEAGCDAYVPKAEMPVLDHVVRVQLRNKAIQEDLAEQNRVLDQHNRRLSEENQRKADREVSRGESGEAVLALRELAANRPDGVLLVDADGFVRQADRGSCEIFGNRIEGKNLGYLAPASGLEAFVRDARSEARDGFRFDISALGGRTARSLTASVVPLVTNPGAEDRGLKVVLLLDSGKRRIAAEMLRVSEPGIPRQQLGALQDAAREVYGLETLVGESPAIQRARTVIEGCQRRRRPILMIGEKGTGKTRIARTAHYSGPSTGPFLQVRCSGQAPENLERTLFGYVKGAFKDATVDHPGLAHQASDGTLFLEEIGDLPLELQRALLDLIDRHEVRRIGADGAEKVEVGIVASSSRSLQAAIKEGTFLRELGDRFEENLIRLPPLVDRQEDIIPLAGMMVTRYGRPLGVQVIAEEAVDALLRYEWPGNVREFEDCIRRACLHAVGGEIVTASLPPALLDDLGDLPTKEVVPLARRETTPAVAGMVPVPSAAAGASRRRQTWDITEDDPISLELYEKKALLRALDHVGGDKLAAAKLLKVGKSTLYRKLKRFDIT